MSPLNEDTLVQQTTAEYLHEELGWDVVYAYNTETFGADGTLGRTDDREVVLTRPLRAALEELNPGLPDEAYAEAVRKLVEHVPSQTLVQTNREKHDLLRDGVPVTYRNDRGEVVKQTLRVFNFAQPAENHFLAVRELWVRGALYRRRADVVGFVNGIPLLFVELKNVHKSLRAAYDRNLADYKTVIPHLFHHNAILLLGNGETAKIGSLTSRYEHFHEWKRLSEGDPGVVDMETLLRGVCSKQNLLDMFENFIVFDDSSGKTVKIVARNHQYLGVNQAVEAVRNREERGGKLGVFWHTQGAGKSYSMVFFTRKVHRTLGSSFTFVVCTDRADLDTQIYKTFAGCGVVDNDRDPSRAQSGTALRRMLEQHKAYVFTLIQKFNEKVDPEAPYSRRDDIIVITDEAHRTQYGRLALNMRDALPNASYIGFTGTPLFKDDEITRRMFGDYISTYDFQRAVDDGATVPLYYDPRGDKLGVATTELNERIAQKLEEIEVEDVDVAQRLERELRREYHVVTARSRLEQIARDFVEHYSTSWESGKAMFVCIDKLTCARMHDLVRTYWDERIEQLETLAQSRADDQDEVYRRRQIAWMRETRMAVVVSEEQGEVELFRKWDLDIVPHRRLMKEGFETPDGRRLDLESAFKDEDHPFRVVFVCAMWLTGFDVPSLANLYLDKPLKAHTLMQAIARANRVHAGKNNGLIVDYAGILRGLRKALATFAGHTGSEGTDGTPPPELDPARSSEQLLEDLAESIAHVRAFLRERAVELSGMLKLKGFHLIAAIRDAREAINENDETRKRFEILAREVFKKWKASIAEQGIRGYRADYEAIDIIYKRLQEERERADVSDIIKLLQEVVDDAIQPVEGPVREKRPDLYDISRIDFDLLRREFERSPVKNTLTQSLKHTVETRLARMLAQNPLRRDLQRHYEEIVDAYNREKDRATVEQTFEALYRLTSRLDEEAQRAVREGLDEQSLALYDLLVKPDLSASEIARVKKVAAGLLGKLKEHLLRADAWQQKEGTRDAVRLGIRDFLWSDDTGLPVETYTEDEVQQRAEEVYVHVLRLYGSEEGRGYADAA